MNNQLLNQIGFLLDNAMSSDLEVVDRINQRVKMIKDSEHPTLNDFMDFSLSLDYSFDVLLAQEILDNATSNRAKCFSNCIEKQDINGIVFIISNCIVRIGEDFFFINENRKVDNKSPIDEKLLNEARSLLIINGLPNTAKRITSPKSFYCVEKIPEDEKFIDSYARYLFGSFFPPNPDEITIECFNRLSLEKDKAIILKWVLNKLNRLQVVKEDDLDVQSMVDNCIFIKVAVRNDKTYYAPLFFTDLYERLDTNNAEKNQIIDLLTKFKERINCLQNDLPKMSKDKYNELSKKLEQCQTTAGHVSQKIKVIEKERMKIVNEVYRLMTIEKEISKDKIELEREQEKINSRIRKTKSILEKLNQG